ncbi:MAG: ribosome biogenesis GTPase YqeH [Bacilli bacterium]|nr:ribosome biogenesis GTPase YqeH [Bacilli bacterium]
MKKCLGCGIELQSENILNVGYTPNIENNYCMRCFKVKNYGEVINIDSNDEDYLNILKGISNTNDLVLYIVDILNIKENLNDIREYLNNDIILVLNKKDILPKSVKDEKIINYLKERYDFKDYVVISSLNNNNLDLLMTKIKKYKTSNNVYVVGETNAGKSSLINKIVGNYSKNIPSLTVSNMPETTLEKIKIKVTEDLTIIDTPGIVDRNNIINYLDKKYYKILNTKREIKPKTYQINIHQSLLIGDFLRIDYIEGDRNSFTLYIPNGIKVKRINSKHGYLKELSYKEYELKFQEDLVIYGLGFIKMVINGKIGIYLNKDVKTFLRKNLI